ncbi:hypothetical protein N0V88_000638 [Collariella sp. IMI 366227]|nr:hypothetical protein N0V88_000638 [Collariella sp. IMI 366227]
MERSLQRQRKQEPGYGRIPKELYVKARDHQNQLTHEERQLLLTHGDLTIDEIHELLLWPPPDVLRANVQRATGGTLGTANELFAKAKDALNRGQAQFDTEVSDEECELLGYHLHPEDDPTYCMGTVMGALGSRGYGAAHKLVSNHMGKDVTVLKAAYARLIPSLRIIRDESPFMRQQRTELMNLMESNSQQLRSGNVTEEQIYARDTELKAMIHASTSSLTSTRLFYQKSGQELSKTTLHVLDVYPGWHFLPEEQKEEYCARAEASRRAAWTEFESMLANTPTTTRLENYLWFTTIIKKGMQKQNTLKIVITGYELFRDEQLGAWALRPPCF